MLSEHSEFGIVYSCLYSIEKNISSAGMYWLQKENFQILSSQVPLETFTLLHFTKHYSLAMPSMEDIASKLQQKLTPKLQAKI